LLHCLILPSGDVVLQGITNDNVVQVTLVGACGSCPMSTVTMKMGLERTLKQRIPSITAVEQVAAPLPVLDTEALEEVLEGVRPIVKIAGGKRVVHTYFLLLVLPLLHVRDFQTVLSC